MEQANINGGPDEIDFAIPGSGVKTISLGAALPFLLGDIDLDGFTQPGSSPNTQALGTDAIILIEIDGGGTESAILANPGAILTGTTIRGLSLVNFAGGAINFNSSTTVSNLVIEGNYIGVRPDGVTKRGNATGILIDNPHGTGNFHIGGTDPAQRNVVSGNASNGIYLNVSDASVQGNLVGTDATGSNALPNGLNGIELRQNGNLIGGTAAGAGNVLSGNGADGLNFAPGAGANNTVQGNLIGLSADGTSPLGNGNYGVHFANAGGANLIGGTAAAARNVISGNGLGGVLIEVNIGNQEVRGNYVGTDATGASAVPNGGTGLLSQAGNGGNTLVGNIISGNVLDGLSVGNGDVVQGNMVGIDASGANPLPNGRHGITAQGSAFIGGTTTGQGNAIAFNAQIGVQVLFPAGGVRILGNSIHSNGAPGIALVGGGNSDQPAPTLDSAESVAGGLRIIGNLTSLPGVYRVELFANTVSDPSGFGEGQAYLGFTTVTIGSGGTAAFTAEVAAPPAGFGTSGFASATAMNQGSNNSSAFSNARRIAAANSNLAVAGGNGATLVFVPDADGRYPSTPSATLAPFNAFVGAVRTSSADVDDDGFADTILVTGPGTPIRVAVVSGADNATLLVQPFDPFGGDFTGGGFVSAGDFDNDGRAEFVVTPDQGGGPRVSIFAMPINGPLQTKANFLGIDDSNFRGGARSALGDVNKDGIPDLLVAAGFGGGPRVALFDGSTLFTTRTKVVNDFFAFPDDATTLRNGVFAALGDLSGDGYADLAFGGGPGGAPRVYILSGQLLMAGSPNLFSQPVANFFVAGNGADRGGVRLAMKNADADARTDLVVGSGEGSPADVRVYLGKNFAGTGEPAVFQDIDVFGSAVLPGGVFVG